MSGLYGLKVKKISILHFQNNILAFQGIKGFPGLLGQKGERGEEGDRVKLR